MMSMIRRWRETAGLYILAGVFTLTLATAMAAAVAQNLGQQPAMGQAVQGQRASTPEGTFLNFVNWMGDAIWLGRNRRWPPPATVKWRRGGHY
jgi:hypothetical protein